MPVRSFKNRPQDIKLLSGVLSIDDNVVAQDGLWSSKKISDEFAKLDSGAAAAITAPVANVVALKAVNVTNEADFPDKILCLVEDTGVFRYNRDVADIEAEDGILVVAPTVGIGRWHRVTLALSGSGTSTTASHSDHDHSSTYEPKNSNIQSHISSTSNPHGVSKTQLDLGNVDNTSDANKPVSTAQQQALELREPAITGGTSSQYWRGDKAWATLSKDTIGLSNVDNTSDANKPVSSATQTALNGKEATVAAGTTSQYYRGDKTWQTFDKASVGLSDVDNTSDANKPISSATQTALNAKENSIAAGTTSQYLRGDKSWQTLDKAAVSLSNVDNTSDANKPISSATQTALNAKLNSSLKGANDGVAELDSTGKVPSNQLPSFVDDVLEYANLAAFPGTGESGKIYVAIDTTLVYRWAGAGSGYVQIAPGIALGETNTTAYRGDRGKTAYDHSQATSGNPHGVTKSDVGLSSVDNTSDANKPVSTATQTALNAKENSFAAGTTAQYLRGDKAWQTLDKSAVGLSNVDNTSDANKPISSATQTALNAKADSSALVTTFTGLTDTPANYTNQGGKFVRVNSGATALEFVDNLPGTELKTGATYTIQSTDHDKVLHFAAGSATTVYLPIGLPVGTTITIINEHATNIVTLATSGGAVLRSKDNLTALSGQYAAVTAYFRGTDGGQQVWYAFGDLS